MLGAQKTAGYEYVSPCPSQTTELHTQTAFFESNGLPVCLCPLMARQSHQIPLELSSRRSELYVPGLVH